ncbi:YT521-B-like domain-containing protein [Zopfochytrium polystomum]|nr:YT521-B-like domain-containing protein [Zopfochytrium polystomum]
MSASSACVPLFQLSGCSSPTTEPESIETADCHQTQYPSPPSTHSSWNATGTNGIAARSATNADEVFGWHHLRRSTNVHSPLHNQLFPHAILPTSPLLFQQNHPYLVDRFGQPNQLFAFPHVLHTGAPFQPYFAVLPGAPHYASYLPPNQMNTTSAPHSQFQPFPQPQFSFTDGDKEVPYNETLNTAMRGDHNLYALQSATSDTSPNLTSSPLAASSPFSTRIDSRGDGDSAALSPPVRSSSTPSLASTSSPAMLGSPLLSVVPHGSGKVRTVFKPSKIAWVGNLPEHTNDREIRMFFETECSVKTLNYVQRTHSCFLQFESDDEADRFISTFDGVCFQGHKLICRIRQISQTQFSPPPALTDMLRYKDRFFIVKSLSVEDIRISLQTGLWATQLKNEPVLNRAYATSNNVFLIFSVNKSGQFFGYARMESPIQADESIPEIAWASIDAVKGNAENDNFIRGRWGRPFKIRWINTRLIAFSRVAGVRNSWNSNKPVHVARDVTEVEPNAASVVIQEFFHPETSQ